MRTVAPPGNLTDARRGRSPRIQGAAAQGLARPFASRVRVACAVAVLLALTVLAAGFSLAVGSRSIPLPEVASALFAPGQDAFAAKVVQARVPRTLFALLAGAAQGISGLLMQRVTRNPIADPSILGVNAGASLFVVAAMAFLGITTSSQYIWWAIFGAALTAVLVYGVGSSGRGGASPLKLALAGTAVSTAFSSLVSIIVMPRENVMSSFRFWQVGSVSGASWADVQTFVPFLLVGVAVPHLVNLLYKGNLRMQMLLTALLGAFVLTAADVLGRVAVSPGELEVGIVTAFVGAPVFIAVAVRSAGAMRTGEVA